MDTYELLQEKKRKSNWYLVEIWKDASGNIFQDVRHRELAARMGITREESELIVKDLIAAGWIRWGKPIGQVVRLLSEGLKEAARLIELAHVEKASEHQELQDERTTVRTVIQQPTTPSQETQLLPQQIDLLNRLVAAHNRLLPDRMSFILLSLADGRNDDRLHHDGLGQGEDRAHRMDVIALREAGFVLFVRSERGTIEFDLKPKAFAIVDLQKNGPPTPAGPPATCLLNITGKTAGQRTIVYLGGAKCELTHTSLRLLVAVVSKDTPLDLYDFFDSTNPHSALSNLKQQCRLGLDRIQMEPGKFISAHKKKVRLGIPTEKIHIDWQALRDHPDETVRRIATNALDK